MSFFYLSFKIENQVKKKRKILFPLFCLADNIFYLILPFTWS